MKLTEHQKEIIVNMLSEFHIGDGVDDCAGHDDVAMEQVRKNLIEYIESMQGGLDDSSRKLADVRLKLENEHRIAYLKWSGCADT